MTQIRENLVIETHRKNSLGLVEGIFEVLKDGKLHTISDIANQIRSHWRTVKNQLEVISIIQAMPKLEIFEGAKNRLVCLRK